MLHARLWDDDLGIRQSFPELLLEPIHRALGTFDRRWTRQTSMAARADELQLGATWMGDARTGGATARVADIQQRRRCENLLPTSALASLKLLSSLEALVKPK